MCSCGKFVYIEVVKLTYIHMGEFIYTLVVKFINIEVVKSIYILVVKFIYIEVVKYKLIIRATSSHYNKKHVEVIYNLGAVRLFY